MTEVKFYAMMPPNGSSSFSKDTSDKQMQETESSGPTHKLISNLKKYLKDGFYFSYSYDLTASLQRRKEFEDKNKDNSNIKPIDFQACDSRYFWNKSILQGFQENNVSIKWYTPLIQGHIGYILEPLGQYNIQVVLLSRRQHLRTGTRMNVRGLDDDGNVANFCETE